MAAWLWLLGVAAVVWAVLSWCHGSSKKPQRLQDDRPIVSIGSRGVLFGAADSSELADPGRKALARLCARAEVYVIHAVADDGELARVRESVTSALAEFVNPVNVLFCQTELGRASMVRQLEPVLHIDASRVTVAQVAIFHSCVLVGSDQFTGKANQPVVCVPAFTPDILSNRAAFPFL